jgi:hypothetical protein
MRRRQIEQAKLQDQNIKLEEQSCRQQATLNAHLRFIARADSHQGKQHKSLQHELQSTQQDLQQVERQLQTTLATLEQCQHDNATYKQQIDALKATTDDSSTDAHKEELLQISLIYDQEKHHLVAQLQQMKTALLEATKRKRQDATTEGQKATTEVTWHHRLLPTMDVSTKSQSSNHLDPLTFRTVHLQKTCGLFIFTDHH